MIGSHLLSVLVAAGDTAAHASDHGHHSAHFPVALPTEGLGYAGLVLAFRVLQGGERLTAAMHFNAIDSRFIVVGLSGCAKSLIL